MRKFVQFPQLGSAFPDLVTNIALMVNEIADAIRKALHRIIIERYGTVLDASRELGIPYKTLYRALTTEGKDRTQRVALDLVLDIIDRLGLDLNYVHSLAVSEVASKQELRQRDLGLVAHPHTEETGELMDE